MINIEMLTITAIKEGFASGKFSSLELVNHLIEKIERTHSELNAVVINNFEKARELAKIADQNLKSGKARDLEGIPYISKALFCSKGLVTNGCSNIIKNFVAPYESTVTQKLLDAGAIMLGAANMDEFAMGGSTTHSIYGPTHNYHIRNDGKKVIAGGSSGGSAAAVAANLAPFALGSDTGGSVRQPASLCGIIGIKPSFGRVSRYGMLAFASSLDQAGLLTNDIDDAALLLGIIAGYDENDSTSIDEPVPNYLENINKGVKGIKIGIPKECNPDYSKEFKLDPDILASWKETKGRLKHMGAEIIDINLAHILHSLATYYIIAPVEACSNLARYDGIRYGETIGDQAKNLDDLYVQNRVNGFGDEVKRRMVLGNFLLCGDNQGGYYGHAKKLRNLIYIDFVKAFKEVDAILMPTSPIVANPIDEKPTVLEEYMADILTTCVSLAGMPGISIPTATSQTGLPIGMQIVANKFNEGLLFQISKALLKERHDKA